MYGSFLGVVSPTAGWLPDVQSVPQPMLAMPQPPEQDESPQEPQLRPPQLWPQGAQLVPHDVPQAEPQ